MKLSENERYLLSVVNLRPEESLAAIRERTGLREHQIHYLIAKLRESGIIFPVPFIDFARIGFLEYKMYFSVLPQEVNARERLRDIVKGIPQVVWVGELGGRYEFGVDIVGDDPLVVQEFFENCSRQMGPVLTEKVMLCTTSFTAFQKAFFSSERNAKEDRQFLRRVRARETVEIDDIDRRILALLNEHGAVSHRELARVSGIPRTTIDSRVVRLRREKVIVGYRYLISATKLNLHIFKVLLSFNCTSAEVRAQLFDVLRELESVVAVTECVGSWDCEVTVESTQRENALAVVRQFSEEISPHIRDVVILPVFNQFQPRSSIFVPMDEGDAVKVA